MLHVSSVSPSISTGSDRHCAIFLQSSSHEAVPLTLNRTLRTLQPLTPPIQQKRRFKTLHSSRENRTRRDAVKIGAKIDRQCGGPRSSSSSNEAPPNDSAVRSSLYLLRRRRLVSLDSRVQALLVSRPRGGVASLRWPFVTFALSESQPLALPRG